MNDLEAAIRCITWSTPRVKGCVVVGKHVNDDQDHSDCDGCAPALRSVGGLCRACWIRLEQVLASWATWDAVLGAEARAFTPESSGRSQPGPRIPLTRMQVEVAMVREFDSRRGKLASLWVATENGAMDAVRFTRAAASTMRAHPDKEVTRSLQRTRCPRCKTASMIYQPPAVPGSDAMVKCVICGYTIDGEHYERLAAIEEQCCRKCRSDEGCLDGSCRCHVSAAVPAWQQTSKATESIVLDPSNPAHRRLYAEFFEESA